MFLFFCRGHSPLLTFASMPLLLSLLRCLYKVKNTRATVPLGFCRKQSRFSFRSFRSAAKGKQQYFYFYFHGEPKAIYRKGAPTRGKAEQKRFHKETSIRQSFPESTSTPLLGLLRAQYWNKSYQKCDNLILVAILTYQSTYTSTYTARFFP